MKNLSNEIAEHSIDMFKARLKKFEQNEMSLTEDNLKELLEIHIREINICLQGFGYSNWSEEERWHELFKIAMDRCEGEYIYSNSPDPEYEFYY
ncbi:MAG: hypothetical protein AD073_000314 [Mycoplasmataceae bacterium]|nr:MAG: hypothetical protein AD073_000314 [Mycoplasmataceae bacterium]